MAVEGAGTGRERMTEDEPEPTGISISNRTPRNLGGRFSKESAATKSKAATTKTH